MRDNAKKLKELGKIVSAATLQKNHSDLPVMAAKTNVSTLDSSPEGDLMSFKYQKKGRDTQTLSHLDSSPQKRMLHDFDASHRPGEYKDSIPVSAISPEQRSKFSKFSANDAVYDLLHIEESSDFTNDKPKKERRTEHSSEFYPVSQRGRPMGSRGKSDQEDKDTTSRYDTTYSNRETILGTRFSSVTDFNGGPRKKNIPYKDREYCYCQCKLI